MSRKCKFNNPDGLYFVSLNLRQGGDYLFSFTNYFEILFAPYFFNKTTSVAIFYIFNPNLITLFFLFKIR